MTNGDSTKNGGHANGGDAKGEGRTTSPGKEALRPLAKRFYKNVTVEPASDGYAIALDGRTVRTPAKHHLVVPTEPLADAVAAEWRAQGTHIDPGAMPLTRLVNSAIDAVSRERARVAADITAFAGSDLLCYRAEGPAALVARQATHWDPVLAWAKHALGADLRRQTGLMPIEQPPQALAAVSAALTDFDALSLAAISVLTTISGSAILALAHARGAVTLDEAWRAATVDETWQIEQWGHDEEAEATAKRRLAEFTAASECLRLLRSRP